MFLSILEKKDTIPSSGDLSSAATFNIPFELSDTLDNALESDLNPATPFIPDSDGVPNAAILSYLILFC